MSWGMQERAGRALRKVMLMGLGLSRVGRGARVVTLHVTRAH